MLVGALALSKNPLEPPWDQKRLKTKQNLSHSFPKNLKNFVLELINKRFV